MRRLFRLRAMLGTGGLDSGCEPHYAIMKSLMVHRSRCGGVQAVCLEELFMTDVFVL